MKGAVATTLITSMVYDKLGPTVIENMQFKSLGPQQFKGVPGPLSQYAVFLVSGTEIHRP